MASAMSYRKTAALLNRVRHETVDPTPMTTVAVMTEREGTAVQAHMDQWATQVLADHAFTDTVVAYTSCKFAKRIWPDRPR